MKKMTTEEKLNKCIDFLNSFNNHEFITFNNHEFIICDEDIVEDRLYYAEDVDEFKDRIWHILADITD